LQKQFIQRLLQTNSFIYISSGLLVIVTFLLCISFGSIHIPIKEVISIILHQVFPNSFTIEQANLENIVMNIRMPRVLLACLVGGALSIAGAAFQGVLKNPLADPYTLGVSSGASVGAVATIFFGWTLPLLGAYTLPIVSIIGSIATIFVVMYFAKKIEKSLRIETVILTGIIFSSFLSAVISLMIALTGDELRQIIGWLLGSVSMRGWEYVWLVFPFLVIGSIILMAHAKEINALAIGEDIATFVGVNVARKKLLILITSAMITGAAVAVSGTIGFVGLVIPHIIRIIVGPNHKHLFPLSLLLGSIFLMLADLISRTIISPQELPIGVVTAIIGAPIFAWILLRKKKRLS